jgi:hypothetical protein
MTRIPCDDIILSIFKTVTTWELDINISIKEIDNVFKNRVLTNFLRCEYEESNFYYFNEEYNILIKLHEFENNKILIYICDNIDENIEHNNSNNYFIEYAKKIEEVVKSYNTTNTEDSNN